MKSRSGEKLIADAKAMWKEQVVREARGVGYIAIAKESARTALKNFLGPILQQVAPDVRLEIEFQATQDQRPRG
jgi:hypothetical protein